MQNGQKDSMNGPENATTRRALLLVALMLGGLMPLSFASAGGGNGVLTTFDTGLGTQTIGLQGSTMNDTIGIDIPRDVTFQGLSFAVDVDEADPSPGQVWLDINNDGAYEWAFLGQGYGQLGHQSSFATGSSVDAAMLNVSNGTTANTGDLLLPAGATLASAALNVTFQPDVTTSYVQTGGFLEIKAADVDADGGQELVVLASSTVNNVNNTSFAVVDYNLTTQQLTMSSWVNTCANATDFSLGDFNNDSRADVFTWNPSDQQVCLHMSNATAPTVGNGTGNASNVTLDPLMPHIRWDERMNLSVGAGLRGAWAVDMNGDGIADVVTYHGGGGGGFGGTNNNGIVNLYPFSPQGTGFLTSASTTLYRGNNRASLQDMWVGHVDNMSTVPTIVLVSSGWGGNSWRAHTVSWDGRNLAEGPETFNDLRDGFLATDLNGDGGVDFVSSGGGFTHVVAMKNMTGWNSTEYTAFDPFSTNNATFGDHDHDGVPSLFMPNAGSGDGNNQTFEGNLTMRDSNGTGLDIVSPLLLQPISIPRRIMFADIDGDGVSEQVVVGGEADTGVFVGGWHRVALDVEGDGTDEISASGYAGGPNSTFHSPLLAEDMFGAIKNALSGTVTSSTGVSDGYGVEMLHLSFNLSATGSGTILTEVIDIAYDARFTVEEQPGVIGNLSNLINQRMETGTGSFRVALPFNSTHQGTLRITDLVAPYTDGAPDIVRPPAPVLRLEMLTSESVSISWQNMSDFGAGLLGFDVYRVPNGTAIDLEQPFLDAGVNLTMDMDVEYGAIYDYAVRSRQVYGLRSNLSDILTVEIPYPDPPPSVLNLTATDVPDDEGGHLRVQWSVEAESTALVHHVLVATSSAANVSTLMPVVSVTAGNSNDVIINATSAGPNGTSAPLVDGTFYHVWVVGEDEHGNWTLLPTPVGPVAPRNDVLLEVQVTLILQGTRTSGEVTLLPLNAPVQATIEALVDGVPLEGVEAWLHVEHEGSGLDRTIRGTTNAQGRFLAFDQASLMAWETTFGQSIGEISMTYGVDALVNDPLRQPSNGSQGSHLVHGLVQVQVDGPSVVEVSEDGTWSATFTIGEVLAEQDGLAPYVDLAYVLFDANGLELASGAMTMNGGTYAFESNSEEAARLEVQPETSLMPWVVGDVHVVTIERDEGSGGSGGSGGTGGSNGSGGTGGIDGLFDLEITACKSETLSRDLAADAAPVARPSCTVRNPNAFAVRLDVQDSATSEGLLRFDLLQGDMDLPAGATRQVTWDIVVLDILEAAADGTYDVDFAYTLSSVENASLSLNGTMTLSWQPQAASDGPSIADDGASGQGSPLMWVMGLAVGLMVLAGSMIFLRGAAGRDDDLDFTEADLEDEMDFLPSSSSEPALDLATTSSLSDLRSSGKDVPEVPESVERPSDALIAEASGLEPEEVEEEKETDDGISVDEFGTEWYEDEVGTWWYREAGQDDWSEYHG